MKATGKQWNDFLASWPDGWWYDDADVTFDGNEDEGQTPAPDARVEVTCGVIIQGEGNAEEVDFVRSFRKWIKEQNYQSVTLELPKTVDLHHFESRVLEMFGAKVVKT